MRTIFRLAVRHLICGIFRQYNYVINPVNGDLAACRTANRTGRDLHGLPATRDL